MIPKLRYLHIGKKKKLGLSMGFISADRGVLIKPQYLRPRVKLRGIPWDLPSACGRSQSAGRLQVRAITSTSNAPMMAQEVDVEFSDAPTSNGSEDENGGFIPLEELNLLPAIEPEGEDHFRDPKKVEKLVSKLQEVVQKAVYSNHQEPIEIASAELKKLGEKHLDFEGFDEAKKVLQKHNTNLYKYPLMI